MTTGRMNLPKSLNDIIVPKKSANVPPSMKPVPIHSWREFFFAGRYSPIKMASNDKTVEI